MRIEQMPSRMQRHNYGNLRSLYPKPTLEQSQGKIHMNVSVYDKYFTRTPILQSLSYRYDFWSRQSTDWYEFLKYFNYERQEMSILF